MKATEIEVTSASYTGKLKIKAIGQSNSFFSVYLKRKLIGRIQPVKSKAEIIWYSRQIADKELISQIGEQIKKQYNLTDDSFKSLYEFES